LAQAVWRRVKQVDLPDVSMFGANMKGIEQFEHLLLSAPMPPSEATQAALAL
jgi:hypothetical protein